MFRFAEISFEAKVVTVSKSVLRFERTDVDWGQLKRLVYDVFGKITFEGADFSRFKRGDDILIRIKSIELTKSLPLLQNLSNIIILRGEVNEKFGTGFSLKKPFQEDVPFFRKVLTSAEIGEVVESTLLTEDKNPFGIADAVELQIGGLTRQSPTTQILKPKAVSTPTKAANREMFEKSNINENRNKAIVAASNVLGLMCLTVLILTAKFLIILIGESST